MSKRFSSPLNVEDLLASKYAKGTDNFDLYTQRLLSAFIQEKGSIIDYTDLESVNGILADFYACVKKENGDYFSLTTFHAIHYSICRIMKDKHGFDIMKDTVFARSNSVFEAMCKELKKNGCGVIKHCDVISDDDMAKIQEWNWTTPQELQWSVWFTIHFHTAMRGRENLHDLKKSDILFEQVKGKSIVRLKDKLTKNHRNDTAASNGGVIFAIVDEKCPVKLVQLYISKLHADNEFLWQRPSKSGIREWYVNQKVGVNTCNTFMKSLSRHLHLSKEYTNHAVRSSAITILGHGFQDTDIATFSGHKSLTALGIYKRTSNECKEFMSNTLHKSISSSSSHDNCCLSFGAKDTTYLNAIKYSVEEQTSKAVENATTVASTVVSNLPEMPTVNDFYELLDNPVLRELVDGDPTSSAAPVLPQIPTDDEFNAFLENKTIRALVDGGPIVLSTPNAAPNVLSTSNVGTALNYKCNIQMHFHMSK
jgi:hypothetical protein